MSNDSHVLGSRKKALEEAFFARHEQELVERFRAQVEEKERRDELARVAGITDPTVIEHLLAQGIDAKTLAALSLVPLVEVAWADGRIEAREREALVRAAGEKGLGSDSSARALLDGWLEEPPGDELLTLWKSYVQALAEELPAEDLARLRGDVLGRARGVAEAAGGFLGLGSKVSDAEQRVLDEMERAFTPTA